MWHERTSSTTTGSTRYKRPGPFQTAYGHQERNHTQCNCSESATQTFNRRPMSSRLS
jgi:hypothetical protein